MIYIDIQCCLPMTSLYDIPKIFNGENPMLKSAQKAWFSAGCAHIEDHGMVVWVVEYERYGI